MLKAVTHNQEVDMLNCFIMQLSSVNADECCKPLSPLSIGKVRPLKDFDKIM